MKKNIAYTLTLFLLTLFTLNFAHAQQRNAKAQACINKKIENATNSILSRLLQRIEVGTGRSEVAGQYYYGHIEGNILDPESTDSKETCTTNDSGSSSDPSLVNSNRAFRKWPFALTVTNDGRIDFMIGIWTLGGRFGGPPDDDMTSEIRVRPFAYRRSTLIENIEREGIEVLNVDFDLAIARLSDDLTIRLDGNAFLFAGNEDLDASEDIRDAKNVSAFYKAAGNLIWNPGGESRYSAGLGYANDGGAILYYKATTRINEDLENGTPNFSTPYLQFSAKPGWEIWGREAELSGRFNFKTDYSIEYGDFQAFQSNPRSRFTVQVSISPFGIR